MQYKGLMPPCVKDWDHSSTSTGNTLNIYVHSKVMRMVYRAKRGSCLYREPDAQAHGSCAVCCVVQGFRAHHSLMASELSRAFSILCTMWRPDNVGGYLAGLSSEQNLGRHFT